MTSLLFYDKPVALNKKAHQDLKLKSVANFSFASNTNSVILAGVEFTEAAKEYPIVFAKAGDNLVPVARRGPLTANRRNQLPIDGVVVIGSRQRWLNSHRHQRH